MKTSWQNFNKTKTILGLTILPSFILADGKCRDDAQVVSTILHGYKKDNLPGNRQVQVSVEVSDLFFPIILFSSLLGKRKKGNKKMDMLHRMVERVTPKTKLIFINFPFRIIIWRRVAFVNPFFQIWVQEVSKIIEISSEFELDIYVTERWTDPALAFSHLNPCKR